jgi:hypothetical protein
MLDPFFVLIMSRKHAPLIFKRVPEWNVREVMQKRGNANEILVISVDLCSAAEHIQHSMSHPGGTKRMFESRMNSRRENQKRRPELPDAPQTLEFGSVHQLDLEGRHFDVSVDRVADEFAFTHRQSCYIGHM